MPVLYITQPGAVLRLRDQSLLVTYDKDPDGAAGPELVKRDTITEVELHRIEQVCLLGKVTVTTDAMQALLERKISAAYFTRGGKLLGQFIPSGSGTIELRRAQFKTLEDTSLRLDWGRRTVSAKLTNAIEVLSQIRSNEPGEAHWSSAISDIGKIINKLPTIGSPEELLGCEGAGSATYFTALKKAFRRSIQFPGRARRPPPDPANALISLGYVLLANRLAGLLEARGFDPECGFYHTIRPGRPSLALDLLEELRHPFVDRFVLRVCNLIIFTTDDFEADTEDKGGVRMKPDALKRFFREWESYLTKPLREKDSTPIEPLKLMGRQTERLASALLNNTNYRPFIFGT